MTGSVLKDRYGNKIGQVLTKTNGTQVIKNKVGNNVGTYDPVKDVTKDRVGNVVGRGNLLATLV